MTNFFETLSKPNEGIHKYRFLGYAIVDVIGTLLFVIICLLIFNALTPFNVILYFCIAILISIFVHKLFKIDTKLTRQVLG